MPHQPTTSMSASLSHQQSLSASSHAQIHPQHHSMSNTPRYDFLKVAFKEEIDFLVQIRTNIIVRRFRKFLKISYFQSKKVMNAQFSTVLITKKIISKKFISNIFI